ncbi:MAG: hypothetical protein IPJ65_15300 [Archangiaceae bacterium]|nr:hypothetical protein [Archangiaceae bacterium]
MALEQARTDATAATRAREQLAAAKEKAAAALKGAQGDLALAEAVVAYGRWRQAVDAATTAATTAAQAGQHAEDSAALLREAEQHDTRAKEALDDAARRRARLPGEEQLQKLERLAHDKAIAEAALGGGLTVTVRPRRPIALHAVADDGAPEAFAGLKTEQQLEAERRVQLTIGDLLDVEIVAGAKELRRAAEVLRRRWKEEMLPALERAEVASLADLQAAVKALAGSTTVAAQARAAAATARAAAEAAASRAALLRSQGSVSKAELDEREARIGDIDRAVLADLHRRAGAGWEKQVEEMKVKTTAAVEVARRALAELDAKLLEAGWRLDDAKQREAKAGEALPALRAALGGLTPQQISSQLAELRAADGAPASEREEDRTAPQLAEARERLQVAQAEHERAQAAAHGKAGEAQALAEAVSPEQRRRLEASAPVELAAAQAGLLQVQAQLDEVTADFNKADGALTSLAGPMARERQAQLDEALAAARVRERELLTDADSWRLLRDALREAESTESAHLGKALAGPVAARFSALTHGRYRAITLSPDLSTEAVEVPGVEGAEVLAALSEGTRDQLATLVRLAIASQLGSALVLDDQLVHTDLARLDWFGQVLREVAAQTQVLVVTCRPLDYLAPEQLPAQQPSLDSPGARAIDLSRLIERS